MESYYASLVDDLERIFGTESATNDKRLVRGSHMRPELLALFETKGPQFGVLLESVITKAA